MTRRMLSGRTRRFGPLALLPWVLASCIAALPAAAAPFTWLDGAGHLWSNSSLWSPQGVPGVGDSVIVRTGVVIVDDARQVDQLTLNAARSGAGVLTTGSFFFEGGVLGAEPGGGSGMLRVTGSATLAGDRALGLERNHVLMLEGSSVWTAGNGAVWAERGGALEIGAGSNFVDLGAADAVGVRALSGSSNSGGHFANNGSYLRQGLGTTALGRFSNNGSFVLQSGAVSSDRHFGNTGSLTLHDGTSFVMRGDSSGTIQIALLATLVLATEHPGFIVDAGGTISNAGTVISAPAVGSNRLTGTLTGGTLALTQGVLAVSSSSSHVARLLLSGGAIAGPGTLTADQFEWRSGGGIGADGNTGGTVVVTGNAFIDGTMNHLANASQALVLNGSTRWSAGGGSIGVDHGGGIVIGATGTFIDEGTATAGGSRGWYWSDEGGYARNEGTYIRRGLGHTDFERFTNAGLLFIEEGSITLHRRAGSNTGEMRLAAGTMATYDDTMMHVSGLVTGDGRLRAGAAGTGLLPVSGVLDPGMPGAFGTLRVSGDLLLEDSALLRLGIGSLLEHDLLDIAGEFTPGGTLALWGSDDLDLQPGDLLTLVNFDALTSGAAFGSIQWTGPSRYRFELVTQSDSLGLRVTDVLPPNPTVPEPSALLLLAAAMGALAVTSRRGGARRGLAADGERRDASPDEGPS